MVEVPVGTSWVVNSVPPFSLEIRSHVSAGGKNPLKSNRIHSSAVRSICPLEHDERRHCVHRQLESSVEKAGAVGSGQDPAVAKSCVPDAGIRSPAGNGVAAAGPDLDLMTALLGAILGDGKRCQNQCQEKRQKERTCTPNGSCHKCGQVEKERYANRQQETNQVATAPTRHRPPAPVR